VSESVSLPKSEVSRVVDVGPAAGIAIGGWGGEGCRGEFRGERMR
jgi:hypothetical protein